MFDEKVLEEAGFEFNKDKRSFEKTDPIVACKITGNDFVKATSDAKNISIKPQGQPGPATLSLNPNQTVYSQVRYPNGPQCSSQTLQATITFSYDISQNDAIVFRSQNEDPKQNIVVCTSPSEITEVQVWSISDKPLTQ